MVGVNAFNSEGGSNIPLLKIDETIQRDKVSELAAFKAAAEKETDS